VARLFKDHRQDEQCLLLVVHEGSAAKVEAEERVVRELLERAGAGRAPDAACEHWLAERNHVPDFKSFLEHGLVVDTIEVAAPWSRIDALYEDAIATLGKVPGVWNGSAHSSHAYRSGINLYFSFACQPQEKQAMRQAYFDCWQAVMAATLRAGGTISHHHGIGRVRRAWLERELGKTGVELLRSIKRTLDPVGFMNPGVLLPDP
jgi:alkyldihydroxyacetonephosphate synthase